MGREETRITKNILRYLKRRGGLGLKIHGNRYMPRGIPDILYRQSAPQMTLWFEVKCPGEKPTPRQLIMHRILRRHYDGVFVVFSVDDVAQILDDIGNQYR